MNKTLLLILTVALLVVITPLSIAIASDITDAVFFGTVRATNTSTVSPNVSGNLSINSDDWISNGTLNATANNIVIRNNTGADTEFMPGYDDNPWIVQFDTVPNNGSIDYTLYTNATGGKIRYFPSTAGANVSDSAGMEPSDNFTMSISGWVDTSASANKTLIDKPDAFSLFVSPSVSGNISAGFFTSDSYITGNNTWSSLYGENQAAQTFTASSDQIVLGVSLHLEKEGTPPATISANITTTAANKPTAVTLASTTFAGADTPAGFDWFDITFDTPASLTSGVKYAIVLAAPAQDGGAGDRVKWSRDSAGATFPNGDYCNSANGGDTWTVNAGQDLLFETSAIGSLVAAAGVASGEHNVEARAVDPLIGIGIDTSTDTNLPNTTNLELNVPFHHTDIQSGNFTSKDSNELRVIVTGATWTFEGRRFNGTTDFIDSGNNTSLHITNDLTLIAWVYPDVDDASQDIISNTDYGAGTTHGFRWTLSSAGKAEVRLKGATEGYYVTSASYSTATWQMFGMVYTAATPGVVMYKQGVVDPSSLGSGTLPTSINDVENDVLIGASRNGGVGTEQLFMDGLIGEVRVYSSAYTAAEILADYNAAKWRYDGAVSGESDTYFTYKVFPSGGVPDTSDNWTFAENGSMPYMETANITIDGVLQGSWEWEYSETFTDLSGNSNDMTPSFRETSSDADVSVSLITFKPISEAKVTDNTSITWPVIMEDPPDEPSTAYSENITPGIFFAPFVHTIAEFGASNWSGATTNMLEQLFWYTFAFMLIIGVSVLVYYFFAKNAKEALFVKIFATASIMIFFALPGINIYGLYVPLYYVFFATGILMLKKDFGW